MAGFPDPQYLTANGIRLAVYEQGAGVPVVLCHGFPELAYSWRYQMPALAAAGFRVIAPDLRGYGRSDRPPDIAAYDLQHLSADLVGLLDALEIERAVFCGHDWGGVLTWAMPWLHPTRVAGVIGVNTPLLPRPPADPVALMRQVYGERMYMVVFQEPGVAEAVLGADVARTLRFFYRRWPARAEAEGGSGSKPTPQQRAQRLALVDALQLPEDTWPGTPLLAPEDFEVYLRAFSETGFSGGLNWYRNLTRNWELTAGIEQRVEVPALMISAANDFVLPPEMADGMEAQVPDLERHVIADCGHWTQNEQPEVLNALLTDWLRRRFGKDRRFGTA